MAPADARRRRGGRGRHPAGNRLSGRVRAVRVAVRGRPHRPAELQLPRPEPRRGHCRDAAGRDHELRAVGRARRAGRVAPPREPGAAAALANDHSPRLLRGDPLAVRGRRHRDQRLQPQLQGPLLGRGDPPRLRDGADAGGAGHHGLGAHEQRASNRPLRRPLRHAGGDAQPLARRPERVLEPRRFRVGDRDGRARADRRQPRHRPHGGGQPRSDRLLEGQPPADRHPPPEGPRAERRPRHAVGRGRHPDPRNAAAAARRGLEHPANIEYEYPGDDTVTEIGRCLEYCKDVLGA